jgi:hypothetical protein
MTWLAGTPAGRQRAARAGGSAPPELAGGAVGVRRSTPLDA